MKILLRIVLSVIGLVVFVALGAFALGAITPVDHSISITGEVAAPPAKVFALIADISAAPTWRPEVQTVEVLPTDNARDSWVEDLGHGVRRKFLAITTAPPDETGHAVRKIKFDDASNGGTWTYELSPGPSPRTTTLKITEDGYINPPIYRFMMKYILGPTKNLDDYMKYIQAAALKG